ncbi:MAG: GNAT family N-acetyltransferase [Candidatus Adiutrix sp.]|jgi:phosphinothricin acetyltransferase|nr:GNAT family N-acetyltransferase [Candidatus Adiutrix sp.]
MSVTLRCAVESDLPALLEIYAPYVRETTVSFEYEPPGPAQFRERFFKVTAQFPWLAVEKNGRLAGYAYASAPFPRQAYQWLAESAIYVAPGFQGQGLGGALAGALETVLARQGYRRLYAVITAANIGSLAFHRARGYEETAVFPEAGYKHGQWLAVVWLAKALNRTAGQPRPPAPFKSLDPRWVAGVLRAEAA